MTTSRGFTIIELLITIVVIGILAAISIISYNGFQERAKVAKLATLFDTYIDAAKIYKTKNGTYPPTTSPDGSTYGQVCLGAAGMFPANSSFIENQCVTATANGTQIIDVRVDNKFVNAIKPLIDQLPDGRSEIQDITVTLGSTTYIIKQRGVIYQASPTADKAEVLYYLPDRYNCTKGEQATGINGLRQCKVSLN